MYRIDAVAGPAGRALIQSPRRSYAALVWGSLLLAAGLLGLGLLCVAAYGDSAEAETWRMRLGIAGALTASCLAQCAVLAGAALLRGARRGRR